jgi:hypothetical protein
MMNVKDILVTITTVLGVISVAIILILIRINYLDEDLQKLHERIRRLEAR